MNSYFCIFTALSSTWSYGQIVTNPTRVTQNAPNNNDKGWLLLIWILPRLRQNLKIVRIRQLSHFKRLSSNFATLAGIFFLKANKASAGCYISATV